MVPRRIYSKRSVSNKFPPSIEIDLPVVAQLFSPYEDISFKRIYNYLTINDYCFDLKLIKNNDEKSYIEFSTHEQDFIENIGNEKKELLDFILIFYMLKNKDDFYINFLIFKEFVYDELYKFQRTKIDSKSKIEHIYNELLLNIFQDNLTEIKDSKIIFEDKSELEIIYSSPMNYKLEIIFRTQFQEIRIKDKLFYFRFYLNGIEDEYKSKILNICFDRIIRNPKSKSIYKEFNLNGFRFIKTSGIIYTEFDKLNLFRLKMFKYVNINLWSRLEFLEIFDNYFQIQFHSMLRIIKFIINHKLLEDLIYLDNSDFLIKPESFYQKYLKIDTSKISTTDDKFMIRLREYNKSNLIFRLEDLYKYIKSNFKYFHEKIDEDLYVDQFTKLIMDKNYFEESKDSDSDYNYYEEEDDKFIDPKIVNKYPRKIKFSVDHENKFIIQFKYHDYSINLDLEAKYIDSPQIMMNVSYSVCDKIFMLFSIINAGNIYSRFEVRNLDILTNEFKEYFK